MVPLSSLSWYVLSSTRTLRSSPPPPLIPHITNDAGEMSAGRHTDVTQTDGTTNVGKDKLIGVVDKALAGLASA